MATPQQFAAANAALDTAIARLRDSLAFARENGVPDHVAVTAYTTARCMSVMQRRRSSTR